jgi:hypothetical protein
MSLIPLDQISMVHNSNLIFTPRAESTGSQEMIGTQYMHLDTDLGIFDTPEAFVKKVSRWAFMPENLGTASYYLQMREYVEGSGIPTPNVLQLDNEHILIEDFACGGIFIDKYLTTRILYEPGVMESIPSQFVDRFLSADEEIVYLLESFVAKASAHNLFLPIDDPFHIRIKNDLSIDIVLLDLVKLRIFDPQTSMLVIEPGVNIPKPENQDYNIQRFGGLEAVNSRNVRLMVEENIEYIYNSFKRKLVA